MTTTRGLLALFRGGTAGTMISFGAVLLAACGSGSSSSPTSTTTPHAQSAPASTVSADHYVTTVCGSLSTWLTTIKSQSISLSTNEKNITSLAEAGSELAAYFQNLVASTDHLTASVGQAGVPGVPNGTKASSTLDSNLRSVRSAFVDAHDNALRLPTNNPTAFTDGAAKITVTAAGAARRVPSAYEEAVRSNEELSRAYSASPACTQLSQETAAPGSGR